MELFASSITCYSGSFYRQRYLHDHSEEDSFYHDQDEAQQRVEQIPHHAADGGHFHLNAGIHIHEEQCSDIHRHIARAGHHFPKLVDDLHSNVGCDYQLEFHFQSRPNLNAIGLDKDRGVVFARDSVTMGCHHCSQQKHET